MIYFVAVNMSSGRKRNRNGNFTSDSPPSTTATTLPEDFVRRVCNFTFFSHNLYLQVPLNVCDYFIMLTESWVIF